MKSYYPWLVLLTFIKVGLAYSIELGVDEAYYYTYAKDLQWSYFDHPFMIALLQWISTLGLRLDQELFLRFFPLFFGLCNPILVYHIGKKIGGNDVAKWASLMYLSTLYASLLSGLFVLPDAPLSFFGLMAIYYSIDYIQKDSKKSLILYAICLAAALASKYQAIFIGFAMFLYMIKFRKKAFNKSSTYWAAMISFIGLLPTLYWNSMHHWQSFAFHGSRVGDSHLFEFFPREIMGQILYQNPFIIILIIIALTQANKVKHHLHSDLVFYLKSLALPLWSISLLLSVFTESLPHWSGIAYIGFIIWAAFILNQIQFSKKLLGWAIGFLYFVMILGWEEVQWGWVSNSISVHEIIEKKGKGDPTQDIFGWEQLNEKFTNWEAQNPQNTSLILSHRWYPAGHLDYYIAREKGWEVVVEGEIKETHQYSLKNNDYFWKQNNGKAYCFAQSNSRFRPESHFDANTFQVTPLDTLYITRRKDTVRLHFVYLVQNYEYTK